MLDRSKIGHVFEEQEIQVEAGALRAFAHAVGETGPVYLDSDAAKREGYRDMLAPPTYTSVLEQLAFREDPLFPVLGVNVKDVLHGQQSFTYVSPICAGDTVVLKRTISDMFEKKSGALQFIVVTSEFSVRDVAVAVIANSTLVIRNDEGSGSE